MSRISKGTLGLSNSLGVSGELGRWRKIPKVELHRHLEGSIRFETVVEESVRLGFISQADASDSNTKELREKFLILRQCDDLRHLLERFDLTQRILRREEVIERVSREIIIDAHRDGIRLLELRYAPAYMGLNSTIPWKSALEAIIRGIKSGQEQCGGSAEIEVGLICIAVGAIGESSVEKTVKFCLENKDTFVGFDHVGPESDLNRWKPYFKTIRDAGIQITCHAAEDHVYGTPNNAFIAISDLHAQRIGHGVQIIKDKFVMERIKEAKVMLEVCVSSNILSKAFSSIEDHPLQKLVDFGIPGKNHLSFCYSTSH